MFSPKLLLRNLKPIIDLIIYIFLLIRSMILGFEFLGEKYSFYSCPVWALSFTIIKLFLDTIQFVEIYNLI